MITLEKAAEKVVECMGVKEGEKILVITDKNKLAIGRAIEKAALKKGQTKLIEIPVGKQHGEEPSADVAAIMKIFDVVIIPTTKSLTHTNARKEACLSGARIATMAGITEDIMIRSIDIDYKRLKQLHDRIRELLIGSENIRVETEAGTDVSTCVVNTRGETAGMYYNKGDFGNLPTGEVDSGVKDRSANGKIVVDASFGGIGKLDSPVTLIIKDGSIKDIEGKDSKRLKSSLDKEGKDSYKIAEFGIGTNPKAIVSGNTLEDEKSLGTCHFGIGNDTAYGGSNDVKIHIDGVIKNPTIYIGEKKIMDKGALLI